MSSRWNARISEGNSSTTPLAGSAAPAPAFRSAATAAAGNAGSITVTKPAGVVAGDVLIAQVHIHRLDAITPPSGWTLVRNDELASPGDDTSKNSVYWKRAGGAEPASYVFFFADTNNAQAAILAYSGIAAAGDPVNAHGGATEASVITDNTVLAPSLAGVTAGSMLVAFSSHTDSGHTWTPPPGMTERVDAESAAAIFSMEAADQIFGAGGATGSRTATYTPATGNVLGEVNVGQMVALSPATPGGGGVFFGVAEEITDFSAIRFLFETNVFPAAQGIEPQFSSDGQNWIVFENFSSGNRVDVGSIARSEIIPVRGRFFRMVYRNGTAAQTFFRLQVILLPEADQPFPRVPEHIRIHSAVVTIASGGFQSILALTAVEAARAVEVVGYGAVPVKTNLVGAAFDYSVKLTASGDKHRFIVRGDASPSWYPVRFETGGFVPAVHVLHDQVADQSFQAFLMVREL